MQGGEEHPVPNPPPFHGPGTQNGERPPQRTNTPAPPKPTPPSQPGTIKPGASPPAGNGIKNMPLFIGGWLKFLTGAAIIGGAIAGLLVTLDVPFVDALLGFARSIMKGAGRMVIAYTNSGLDDIRNAVDNFNPQLAVFVDLAKVALDVTGIVINFITTITSLQSAAQELGRAGSFFRAIQDLGKPDIAKGRYLDHLNLARFNILGGIFGGYSLFEDWNQLQVDVANANAS
jgi:hypothetical protein